MTETVNNQILDLKQKNIKDINKKIRQKQIEKHNDNVLISLINVTKVYDTNIVLKGITFDILENQFVTILGYSGCGKSTTLRLLSGFEKPTSGEILFQNRDLIKIPINKRPFNTVFQNYALFPHMNVFDNVAYGLKLKKYSKQDIQNEVANILRKVGLQNYEDRNIASLSGGQKQRVAIARALVNKPKVLLLDEPLAALDAKKRKEMQQEIKKLQIELGITFVYVTHDQEEAMKLSDKIILLNNGIIEQVGKPEEIYNEPENKWVANFIGDANILEDSIFVKDFFVKLGGKNFECADAGFGTDENVDVVIRPEDIRIYLNTQIKKKHNGFEGKIISSDFKGIHFEYNIDTKYGGNDKNFLVQTTKKYEIGEEVIIEWSGEDIHVMWKDDEFYANKQ